MTNDESGLVVVLILVATLVFSCMQIIAYHWGYYEGRSCVMDRTCMPKADK